MELYISGKNAKSYFYLLKENKDDIEKEIGFPLEWEERPDKQDCRIAVYFRDVDLEDREDWLRQHEWLAARINDFHRIFANRVRDLRADDWSYEKMLG